MKHRKNNQKIDKISVKYLLTDISFRILYWYLQMLDIMLIYGWYTQDFNPYHQKHRWVHWRENHRKWFFPLKRKPTVSRFLKGNLIKYSDQWRTHIESKAHFVSGPLRFSFCLRVTSAALHIKKKCRMRATHALPLLSSERSDSVIPSISMQTPILF